MYFCADCGQVLDERTHSLGVAPCPRCGSGNVSADVSPGTVRAEVKVHDPGIKSLLNWSGVWLSIAHERVGAAHGARKTYDNDPSGALTAEFHAGLVAIAAAAFAVEAEKIRVLGDQKVRPVGALPSRSWTSNMGDYLGQLLLENGHIEAATAHDLGRLFALRHDSAHPLANLDDVVWHPVGTNTSRELVAYNADVAEELVAVAEQVIEAIGVIQ